MNEKTVQARVPEELDQCIIARAETLGVTKSALIRKCLMDRFIDEKKQYANDFYEAVDYLMMLLETSKNLSEDEKIIQKEVNVICQIMNKIKTGSQSCVG